MTLKFWFLTLSIIFLFGSIAIAQDEPLSAMGVEWSPDGRWIAVNTSAGVWVFDAENPDAEPSIYYEGEDVRLMAANPTKNELAVIMSDMAEYSYKNGVINLDTGEASEADQMLIGGNRSQLGPISLMSSIFALSYSADGAYVIMALDSQVFFYEPTFHRVDFSQLATEFGNYIVSVSQIGDTGNFLALTWAEGDNLMMVNREGGLLSSFQPEHSNDTVYYFDDSRAILPASSGVYLFDFGSEEEELLLAAPENNSIGASAYFAPSSILVIGGYGFWQSLDVVTAEAHPIVEIESEAEYMRPAAFDFKPDGSQIVILQSDGILSIWDVETGEMLYSWQAFEYAYSIKWG